MKFRPYLILVAILCFCHSAAGDDETSFSPPPDATWQRVEPLKELGQDLAQFDFTNQTCRITCGVPPFAVLNQWGIAALPRASLLAPTTYANSVASVDILTWQPPQGTMLDGSFPGVFTRIQPNVGLGKTTGWALALQTLQGGMGRLRLYSMNNEALSDQGQSLTIVLEQGHSYRLVLISHGNQHTGRLCDLATPHVIKASVSAVSGFLANASGRCGFGVAMPHPLAIDVTFDNFLSWDGTPTPLTIRKGTMPETIELLCNTRRAMACTLQTTVNFTDPSTPWFTAYPDSTTVVGDQLLRVFPLNANGEFFRHRSP